jgi:septal ring factor EnvC (AmiA/AmiB activator)
MPRSKKLTLKKNKTSKSITKKSRSSRRSRKTLKGGVNPNNNEVNKLELILKRTETEFEKSLNGKKQIIEFKMRSINVDFVIKKLNKLIRNIMEINNQTEDTLKYKKELSAVLRLLDMYIEFEIASPPPSNINRISQYYRDLVKNLKEFILNENTKIKDIIHYKKQILKEQKKNHKNVQKNMNNSEISSATASPVSGSNKNFNDFVMVNKP